MGERIEIQLSLKSEFFNLGLIVLMRIKLSCILASPINRSEKLSRIIEISRSFPLQSQVFWITGLSHPKTLQGLAGTLFHVAIRNTSQRDIDF